MAKQAPKKKITQEETPLQLESVVIAHEQELQKLAEGNTSLIAKNSKLQALLEDLQKRHDLLMKERIQLRSHFYTISMRLHEWSWCVPSLKKKIKEVVNIAVK